MIDPCHKKYKPFERFVAAAILLSLLLTPLSAWSAQIPIPGFYAGTVSVPDNALPRLRTPGVAVNGVGFLEEGSSLTVDQQQERVIIDWESFNVGKDASVHFDQKETSWTALNRIYDVNPSQILGKLSADAKIYLINQNGILFGPNSQVNVRGLIASALNLSDADFIARELRFRFEDYQVTGNLTSSSTVANHGQIATDYNGSVYLIAPKVENYGEISVPGGRVALIAGENFNQSLDFAQRLELNLTDTGEQGTVYNAGTLAADSGVVGLYGKSINHDGVIRSITALKKNGRVELLASDRIQTSASSRIESPISETDDTANDSFQFSGGEVVLAGLTDADPVRLIEHNGVIRANSGSVEMTAEQRVLLNDGSSIDVSGVWTSRNGDSNEIEAQLNSVQLRDDYIQKDGLLQGKTVSFNALLGSGIGDVSGNLSVEEQSALEKATAGGTVRIRSSGDIVVKDAAEVDISGGGILFDGGFLQTTKLVANGKIYDIETAPDEINYETILTEQTVANSKFGVEKYSGFYYGGAAPLYSYVGPYTQGSNAGSFQLVAPTLVLNGILSAGVSNGIYQTEREDPVYEYSEEDEDRIAAVGRQRAKSGTLTIGVNWADETDATQKDHIVEEVVIATAKAILDDGLDAEPGVSPLPEVLQGRTVIAAETLNSAELSTLQLYANGKATFEQGSQLVLDSGGRLKVHSRTIEQQGEIIVPGGQIEMTIGDNVTSLPSVLPDRYVPMEQKIYLGQDSVLSVAGEQVNNSTVVNGVNAAEEPIYLAGGEIILKDKSRSGQGVIATEGSLIDVSGGYYLDESGNISGASAGSLSIQGHSIALAGELSGSAVLGQDGGSIALHADRIEVTTAAGSELPADLDYASDFSELLPYGLSLNQNRFEQTGFSRISLKSFGDLLVAQGSILAPSTVKYLAPQSGFTILGQQKDVQRLRKTQLPELDLIGDSAINLEAGVALAIPEGGEAVTGQEIITLAPTASVNVAPLGTISLNAPAIEIDGQLSAPAGSVAVVATSVGGLRLGATGRILARGYNLYDREPLFLGMSTEATPLAGGEIALRADIGSVLLETGSLIDVSAAPAVTRTLLTAAGAVEKKTIAADAGTVEIRYFTDRQLAGQILGSSSHHAYLGGHFSLTRLHPNAALTLTGQDMSVWQQNGFDSLTFSSEHSLQLLDSFSVDLRGKLILDSPLISSSGAEQSNQFSAAWIELTNNYYFGAEPLPGNSSLYFNADWIDVTGDMRYSGISDLTLQAGRGIKLSDLFYQDPSGRNAAKWSGLLETAGNLTLQAAAIYPTTAAHFSLISGETLRISRPVGTDGLEVVSAGGSLLLQARDIEQDGTLLAPTGQIVLDAENRLYLSENSLTSTRNDHLVVYGDLDEDGFWTLENKADPQGDDLEITIQPDSGVALSADQIIVKAGSTLDISGGGGLLGYQFLRGTEGSVSPLDGLYLKSDGSYNSYYPDRYVIVPGIELPGMSIQLAASELLPAGTYSLLPDEYAFLPGAMVVETTGQNIISPNLHSSFAGQYLTSGKLLNLGGSSSPFSEVVVVRSAAEVLREGAFNYSSLTTGNAGTLSVVGQTTVLDGALLANALPGYRGGQLTMSASANAVVKTFQALPDDFGFSDEIPLEMLGQSQLLGDSVSGRGWSEINIGTEDGNITDSIMIEADSVLEAENINLYANELIDIQQGALVHASANAGQVLLDSPAGLLKVAPNATVHAGTTVALNVANLDMQGRLISDNSSLRLASDVIYLVRDDYLGDRSGGLYLTESLQGFEGFESIYLTSHSDLIFKEQVDFSAAELLWIDAARLVADTAVGGETVSLSSKQVWLSNSGASSVDTATPDAANLEVNADRLTIGPGEILFDGFNNIALNSLGDLTFAGESGINAAYDGAGSGALTLSGARVTTSYYRDSASDSFTNGNAAIAAAGRTLRIIDSGGQQSSAATTIGGQLRMTADVVDQQGIIDVNAGLVALTATGTGGVTLGTAAQIKTRGAQVNGERFAAGKIILSAEQGGIDLAAGSLLDVAAAQGEDAGSIVLQAASGDVNLSGELQGFSASGQAGSFSLDSGNQQDLDVLSIKLAEAGLAGDLAIETHAGALSLGAGHTLTGRSVLLAADGGSLTVDGTVTASAGENGGDIELWSQNDLQINGELVAVGTAEGGSVKLGSSAGTVTTATGSLIDVSGDGEGKVYVRAERTANDVKADLFGQVRGAAEVFVEGFTRVQDSSITTADINSWKTATSTFMTNNAAAIEARLLGQLDFVAADPDQFAFLPGLEIYSSGNLALQNDWDLTRWRYAGGPGVVTLRAAGDLNLNQDLFDHPTFSFFSLRENITRDSWGINLIAGADPGAANLYQTGSGSGDLNVAANTLIYSESAPLTLVAGRDVVLGSSKANSYMIAAGLKYSLGSFDQNISIQAGRDLSMTAAGLQTATGDVKITAGGDLLLGQNGAIRSAGTAGGISPLLVYELTNGGDITLDVTGSVAGLLNDNYWDEVSTIGKYWTAKYTAGGATGIISSGGGDIQARAFGDYAAQTGTFGLLAESHIDISAGGDLDGRFVVYRGDGTFQAGGSFGKGLSGNTNQSFEAFDTHYSLVTQGDIRFGSVVNPTVANKKITQGRGKYEMTYAPTASAELVALLGDVVIAGVSGYRNYGDVKLDSLMPASLSVNAQRDIKLQNSLTLLGALDGNLLLKAGRNIDGQFIRAGSSQLSTAAIYLSDTLDVTINETTYDVYGVWGSSVLNSMINYLSSGNSTAKSLLHAEDPVAAQIDAGQDISNLKLYLSKKAEIVAGRDISNIYLQGQNAGVAGNDLTLVKASRDLAFSTSKVVSSTETGINLGGKGVLAVLAGNNLDLGTTSGIKTIANLNNSALPVEGSELVILVGSDRDLSSAEARDFFDRLREAGIAYSTLLATDAIEANRIVAEARTGLIEPFFAEGNDGEGNIYMTLSSIQTLGADSDLFLISKGSMNVGQSSFSDDESTGITSEGGGSTNVFASGDIDVLESRIMTKFGGDITVWSDQGNVNAGRGSSTAVSPGETKIELDPETKELVTTVVPAAVGSGIRTLTFDPDGFEGPRSEPELGSVYLFAPTGVIDAGEAGIRGKRVILGATEVLNSQNISFSGGSVGVPVSADGASGLSALGGTSNVTDVAKIAEDTAAMGQRNIAESVNLVEDFMAKWIEAKVIGYPETF